MSAKQVILEKCRQCPHCLRLGDVTGSQAPGLCELAEKSENDHDPIVDCDEAPPEWCPLPDAPEEKPSHVAGSLVSFSDDKLIEELRGRYKQGFILVRHVGEYSDSAYTWAAHWEGTHERMAYLLHCAQADLMRDMFVVLNENSEEESDAG